MNVINRDDGDSVFEINGDLDVGKTLSIKETISDVDGSGALNTFRWEIQDKRYGNLDWHLLSTNPTYKIQSADQGKKIKARISYVDDQGFGESIWTNEKTISYKNDGTASFSIQKGIGEIKLHESLTHNSFNIFDKGLRNDGKVNTLQVKSASGSLIELEDNDNNLWKLKGSFSSYYTSVDQRDIVLQDRYLST